VVILPNSSQVIDEPIVMGKDLCITQPESLVGDIFAAVGKQGACLFDGAGDLFDGDRYSLANA